MNRKRKTYVKPDVSGMDLITVPVRMPRLMWRVLRDRAREARWSPDSQLCLILDMQFAAYETGWKAELAV